MNRVPTVFGVLSAVYGSGCRPSWYRVLLPMRPNQVTVLTHWAQGGPVAIHGTNAPWSIGRAVWNGCIRVPNAVLRRLWAAMPPGTPVRIRR